MILLDFCWWFLIFCWCGAGLPRFHDEVSGLCIIFWCSVASHRFKQFFWWFIGNPLMVRWGIMHIQCIMFWCSVPARQVEPLPSKFSAEFFCSQRFFSWKSFGGNFLWWWLLFNNIRWCFLICCWCSAALFRLKHSFWWFFLIFVDDFWFVVDAVQRRQGFMIMVNAGWLFGDAVQRLSGLNIVTDDRWWLNLITF